MRDASGAVVSLPRRKQRGLLALLLLRAGTPITLDDIVDSLWGARPPNSARANVHSYISDLRRLLGGSGGRLVSVSHAYRLDVDAGACDVHTFESAAADGRRALADGRPAAAAERLTRALGLWRGAPLEGLELTDALLPHAARLDQARLAAVEDEVEARLTLGQHEVLAEDLAGTVTRHPVRERLWGQYMVALHRAGRRAEALNAYNRLYDALEAELGVTPGAAVRELHRRIRSDTELPAARTTPEPVGTTRARPAMLPPDIPDFTGRAAHLATLGAALQEPRTALAVAGVAGMAGVGKSALAVRAAHLAAPAFPDGQLYMNLRGPGGAPLDPADVLARLIRMLGGGDTVPAGLAERAEVYRSRLAGRRVLVLLDNASSEAQVRPLLPGSASCAVLVTSRRRLTGVAGVRWFDLDVLTATEAVTMLGAVVRDGRVERERECAASLARLCGGLPLALRIVGARLTARPAWPLAHLVGLLTDERRRLDRLAIGGLEVRASLALSLGPLDDGARRLFGLLGRLDRSEFPGSCAAAVFGAPAEEQVESLVDARLLAVAGAGPDGEARYRLHDLVRLLAREQ